MDTVIGISDQSFIYAEPRAIVDGNLVFWEKWWASRDCSSVAADDLEREFVKLKRDAIEKPLRQTTLE